MKKRPLDPELARLRESDLPPCTFCRTVPCWNCIHFERQDPDSKGQCRCDYYGRWYYPHEGCTNGTPIKEYREEERRKEEDRQREALQRERDHGSTYREPSRGSGRSTGGGSSGGEGSGCCGGEGSGCCGLLVILLALLFSAGLLKTSASFHLISDNSAAYQSSMVHWDNGSNSYPKNFSNYTATTKTFSEKGWVNYDLKDGKYDLWLSRDGVSGYASRVYNTSFLGAVFGIDSEIHPDNVDMGTMFVAHLSVSGGSGGPLTVTDENDKVLNCTSLGEDGSYVLLLPDSDTRIHRLTLSMEGCEAQTLTLDFTDSRIVRAAVRFRSN